MEKQTLAMALNRIVNTALSAGVSYPQHQQTLADAKILDAFLGEAFNKKETPEKLKEQNT